MSRPQTRYHRAPAGFHVTVGDTYRGFLPKHRPGHCACCEELSQWPLCPSCHDIILETHTPFFETDRHDRIAPQKRTSRATRRTT